MEDKTEYLIKTLSRTERKDYENYVINRIYSKLNDLDIKPMSQKYVSNEKDGGYYLIDLYFPQLNIGIECDEGHHQFQQTQDKIRTEDIISSLEDYQEIRIVVYNKSIIEINNEIDEIVKYIKRKKEEKIKNGTFKKWELLSPEEYFKDKDEITIDDDIEFNTMAEVCNIIFGKHYKGLQRTPHPIGNVAPWFPILALEKNGEKIPASHGWLNTINNAKTIIWESSEEYKNYNDFNSEIKKVTFMKMKDKITGRLSYKFLGIFQATDISNGVVTYKRIDTKFKIIRNNEE